MSHHIFWVVSLSNGETIYEGKGNYAIIQGELSPWQKLMAFLRENPSIKITSLNLYTDDNRRFNLPSAGRNPKFKVFCEAEKPIDYKFFRKAGIDFDANYKELETDIYAVIEATYADGKKLQMWVADNNPNNVWAVIL